MVSAPFNHLEPGTSECDLILKQYIYIYVYTYIKVYLDIYKSISRYINIYIYSYIYIDIYINISMFRYICKYFFLLPLMKHPKFFISI
jgi:hypothetical protein